MKAIKIDAVNMKVEEIEINGLVDMQKAVGGFIQVGHYFETFDDVLYVVQVAPSSANSIATLLVPSLSIHGVP